MLHIYCDKICNEFDSGMSWHNSCQLGNMLCNQCFIQTPGLVRGWVDLAVGKETQFNEKICQCQDLGVFLWFGGNFPPPIRPV